MKTPQNEYMKVAHSRLWVDCEQPLFFLRFSKGSARARERWAALATRVVICVSRAFCSTDQKKREIAGSLGYGLLLRYINDILQNEGLDFLRFFCLIFFLVELKVFQSIGYISLNTISLTFTKLKQFPRGQSQSYRYVNLTRVKVRWWRLPLIALILLYHNSSRGGFWYRKEILTNRPKCAKLIIIEILSFN